MTDWQHASNRCEQHLRKWVTESLRAQAGIQAALISRSKFKFSSKSHHILLLNKDKKLPIGAPDCGGTSV